MIIIALCLLIGFVTGVITGALGLFFWLSTVSYGPPW